MDKLQKPEWVYMNGRLCPWDDAVLHISSEAVTRGLNVYEGLKGYWSADNKQFGIVALTRHYARLQRSARLLSIPCLVDFKDFETACYKLVKALYEKERDMWIRATLYVVEGHWGEGTVADLVLTAYHQNKTRPLPISVGVSTWRRSVDVSLPPRIKTSPNYEVARLARIEGRGRGFSEMILLNQFGRVAEATGCCLVMVRDGKVYTPPAYESRLESITLEIVADVCRTERIEFIERPIDRTELYIADELCLVGTLAEIVPVKQIDDFTLPKETPVLNKISERFWSAVRGINPHPKIDLSFVPK
jgi:branched-chain amino acid aminotransferase